MASYPWRFQADVVLNETDPMVTVFVGDLYTNDSSGEKIVRPDTMHPVTVRLSELPSFIETASVDGVTREEITNPIAKEEP